MKELAAQAVGGEEVELVLKSGERLQPQRQPTLRQGSRILGSVAGQIILGPESFDRSPDEDTGDAE